MKVGDIVQEVLKGEVGIIIEVPVPLSYQTPFVYVLNTSGQIVRWIDCHCEVINESR